MYRVKKYLKIFSFALLFLLIGLLIFEYIRIKPKDVYFTNITSSSTTVSWTTKIPIKGFAVIVDANSKMPLSLFSFGKEFAYDSRDYRNAELLSSQKTSENIAEGGDLAVSADEIVSEVVVEEIGKYYTHHVEIRNLDPETEYQIMVGDGLLFTKVADIEGDSKVKTSAIPESVPAPIPAYGSVKDANNQDLAIEDLIPVKDAVIYFNYLEELSGERSNLISGALNDEGNWYIDVSTAVDSEGNNFLEKFEQGIPANLFAEVLIDAGPLGQWKKQIYAYNSSPAEMIVLNVPNSSNDSGNPEILQKIESSIDNSEVVKGVNAMEDGCMWISYCGCGKSVDYTWVDCDCDPAVLESRGCTSQQSADQAVQEVVQSQTECSGDGVEGSTYMSGTTCKVCTWNSTGAYLLWVTSSDRSACPADAVDGHVNPPEVIEPEPVDDTPEIALDKMVPGDPCVIDGVAGEVDSNNKCVKTQNIGETTPQISLDKMPPGDACLIGGEPGKVDTKNRCILLTGDRDNHIMDGVTVRWKCYDVNGCACIYGSQRQNINYLAYCEPRTTTAVIPEETPAKINAGAICTVSGSQYPNNGRINSEGDCVQNKTGDRCVLSFAQQKFGKFNQYGICSDPGTCDGTWTPIGNSLVCTNEDTQYWTSGEDKTQYWTSAEKTLKIKPGEKCVLSGDYKSCSCLVDTYLGIPQYVKIKNNETCSKDLNPSSSLFFDKFSPVKKAYADETELEFKEYVIDTTNSSIAMLYPGEYIFEHEGDLYFLDVSIDNIIATNGNIKIYIDSNENDKYDEGIDKKVSELGSILNIATINQSFTYELVEGYNFVSLPFVSVESNHRTAAGLLKALNDRFNDSVYSISRYDGSWKVVGQNTEVYDNNDFQLIPGQGYIIKAKRDILISISGQPILYEKDGDQAPILFSEGWNLIGMYGTNVKQYTAKSLIQGINASNNPKFTANNVTNWESDVQRYDGFQLDVENGVEIEYGFDFPIKFLQGYFVRVTQGQGNWQPELR